MPNSLLDLINRAPTPATTRFSVIEGSTAQVSTYALSNEAYTDRELGEAICSGGFSKVDSYPSLTGEPMAGDENLPVLVARK